MPDEQGLWRQGGGSTLVGVRAETLASTAFNDRSPRLHIAGVRETHAPLFDALDDADAGVPPGEVFHQYMNEVFRLDRSSGASTTADGRRRYRTSYLRLLRGWAYDANSPEGAVLKGWVESRFGILPTFHKEPIKRVSSPAWSGYVEEKMASRFQNTAIMSQLDVLYEFAQWRLERTADEHWRLFRGTNDFDEHPILERTPPHTVVLRLNNLVSFTKEREVASCFGDWILEADVPLCKILVFPGMLPNNPLKAEAEVLVIGGAYRATACYY